MKRLHPFALAACVAWLAWASVAAADEKSAEEVLKAKGIRKLANGCSLAEETELSKRLREVQPLKKTLLDALKAEQRSEAKAGQAQKLISDYLTQRQVLRQRLARVRSPDEHNAIVLQIGQLGDEIVRLQAGLQKGGELEAELKAVREKANGARETYVQFLLDTRKLVETAEDKYATLSADADVKSALGEIGKAAGKKFELAPTRSFLSNVKALKKLEDMILSETIDLKRDGDLFNVPVVFNGESRYTKELAVDTGSSVICLPHQAANDVGLSPTDESPTITLRLADGREVQAKLVKAKQVRVGKFTVEDVECAVLGPELVNAPPILGQSYLRHFSYKIDSENEKMIMTRVEAAPRGR